MADPKKPAPRNGEVDNETGNQMAGTSGDKSGGGETGTNEVNLEATRRVPDERLEKLNEANKEGHEKNMKAIEEAHKGDVGKKPAPQLGKEDNGNTPRVNKDGSKSWFPPGVAGAPRA
jgi:hypothetical protein